MTVETTDVKQTFAGGQDTADFSFKTLPAINENVKVKKTLISTQVDTDLVLDTDYTVAIDSDGVGGTVTFTPSLATTFTTTVYRETTNKQETDYTDFNQFPADTVETDIDRRTLISQEDDEALDRTLSLSITTTLSSLTLPNPSSSTILAWNSAANAIENIAQVSTTVNAISESNTTQSLKITQSSTGRSLLLNQDGNGIALEIDSESTTTEVFTLTTKSTTGAIFHITANDLTSGSGIVVETNSRTTGLLASFTSSAAGTDAGDLVKIVNDNALATGTRCFQIQQDSDGDAFFIVNNGNGSGMRLDGCTEANGSNTVTISNLAPSGVGTATIAKWLKVDLDDITHYIPCWT